MYVSSPIALLANNRPSHVSPSVFLVLFQSCSPVSVLYAMSVNAPDTSGLPFVWLVMIRVVGFLGSHVTAPLVVAMFGAAGTVLVHCMPFFHGMFSFCAWL